MTLNDDLPKRSKKCATCPFRPDPHDKPPHDIDQAASILAMKGEWVCHSTLSDDLHVDHGSMLCAGAKPKAERDALIPGLVAQGERMSVAARSAARAIGRMSGSLSP